MYTQICVSLRTVSHSEDISRARRLWWWWERPLSSLSLKTTVIRVLTNLATLAVRMVSPTPLPVCLGALHQLTALMSTAQAAPYIVQLQHLWMVLWKTAGFSFAFNTADASQLWFRVAPQNYWFLFDYWLKCNAWAHTSNYFPKTWPLALLYAPKNPFETNLYS